VYFEVLRNSNAESDGTKFADMAGEIIDELIYVGSFEFKHQALPENLLQLPPVDMQSL
jgi:hypothetical protein